MSSPLNDPQVEQWLQRFDTPLKRLPVADRLELHSEVRQHLDALVAANEELGNSPGAAWAAALRQFGDPTQIGLKMYKEWQQDRAANSSIAAVGFGTLLHLSCTAAVLINFQCSNHNSFDWLNSLLTFTSLLLINAIIGWGYPYQALRAVLYGDLFSAFASLLFVLPVMLHPHTEHYGHSDVVMMSASASAILLRVAWSVLRACSVAYLASVTKRGWYKPSLADFKLTLPRDRRQTSR